MSRLPSSIAIDLAAYWALALTLALAPGPARAHVTTRVSVDAAGTQGEQLSLSPAISADGRFVAFVSTATNLVPEDANGVDDVFLHDNREHTTIRVSVGPDGQEANAASDYPSISADGGLVAFESTASNLVAADTNAASDVFVRDTANLTTVRASTTTAGAQGNGGSSAPSISADGSLVAFLSAASNLVAADTNGVRDVFVRNLRTGFVARGSLDSDGNQAYIGGEQPAISADGRWLAFASWSPDLVPGDTNNVFDVFVRDLLAGVTSRVSVGADGSQGNADSYQPWVSAAGRLVAYVSGASTLVPGDTNGQQDAFLHDRWLGVTERASVSSTGEQANLASSDVRVSADGGSVTFGSTASNLVVGDDNGLMDVFLRERDVAPAPRLASAAAGGLAGNNMSAGPTLSADGRHVAFASFATNLVEGDTNNQLDAFVRDTLAHRTRRASVDPAGAEANHKSEHAVISATGRFVAFSSFATNLTGLPTNDMGHVYVKDQETGAVLHASVSTAGRQGNDTSFLAGLSANGRFVAFSSAATNLVPGKVPGFNDIFVRDVRNSRTTLVSRSSSGEPGNGPSEGGGMNSISATGRHVAFTSRASNLVAGDTNEKMDVFVHDRGTGRTTRESTGPAGGQSGEDCWDPVISGDGRFVVFGSTSGSLVTGDTNGKYDVFVRDRATGQTTRASLGPAGRQADGESFSPAVSGDGRFVAFTSKARNLVAGAVDGTAQVFVRDRWLGRTILAGVGPDGSLADAFSSGARLSSDGGTLAFCSPASNLVPGHLPEYHVFTRVVRPGADHRDDFSDADEVGDPQWREARGDWHAAAGPAFAASGLEPVNLALYRPVGPDTPLGSGEIGVRVRLQPAASGPANAEVVFAVQDSSAYRYVRLTPGRVVIGQKGEFGGGKGGIVRAVAVPSVAPDRWQDVAVLVDGKRIVVVLDGARVATGTFPGKAVGSIGLLTRRSPSLFREFEVRERLPR